MNTEGNENDVNGMCTYHHLLPPCKTFVFVELYYTRNNSVGMIASSIMLYHEYM